MSSPSHGRGCACDACLIRLTEVPSVSAQYVDDRADEEARW
jgi:hypothetical protein